MGQGGDLATLNPFSRYGKTTVPVEQKTEVKVKGEEG
jgi:hypothetical protein